MDNIVAKKGTFPWAIIKLQKGHSVARNGWNGKGLSITKAEVQPLGEDGFVVGPFLFIRRENDMNCNTWVPSISDLFAEDWDIADG
jgi:hypothetical protein